MLNFLYKLPPLLHVTIFVVCYSLYPIFFVLGMAWESPFLFAGIWMLIGGIGTGTAIVAFQRKIPYLPQPSMTAICMTKKFWNKEKKKLKPLLLTKLMLFSVVGKCAFVLYPFGFIFVSVSTLAMLTETRGLILVLAIYLWKHKDAIHLMPIKFRSVILGVPAFAGVVLVILSHIDTPQLMLAIETVIHNPEIWIGVILVLSAVFFSVVGRQPEGELSEALAYRISNYRTFMVIEYRARVDRTIDSLQKESLENEEMLLTEFIGCTSQVIAGVFLCVIGWIVSETISSHQMLYASVGPLVFSIGLAFIKMFRSRQMDESTSAENKHRLFEDALVHTNPLVIVFFLWAFSVVEVPHMDYLIIGALGIIVSKLLIELGGAKRGAYKALMVSLWIFGTITYIFGGYETDIPLELPVTVFILVLAFRVAKLVRRTDQEEDWVIDMFHRLRLIDSKQKTGSEVSNALEKAMDSLLLIDRHKTPNSLETAYNDMVNWLEEVRRSLEMPLEKSDWDKGPVDEISEIRRLVDKLAHSRQQGSRFDEKVAICLTGMLIVGGLLFFNGDGDLYGEITSFVLSSIVVFLFFNIVDLENDRRDRTLKDKKLGNGEAWVDAYRRYSVTFEDAWSRERERISVLMSGMIVVVFVVLLLCS